MNRYKSDRMKKIFRYLVYISTVCAVILLMQLTVYAMTLTAAPADPNSDTQVELEWSPVAGAVAYQIYRDAAPAPIASIDVNQVLDATNYTDTGLTPETLYNYRVRAYSNAARTNEIDTQTAPATTSKMLQPTITSIKYDINVQTITVTWVNNSYATTGSAIWVEGLVDVGQPKASIAGTGTTAVFTEQGIVFPSPGLQYVVVSGDSSGHASDPSLPATVFPIQPPSITATIDYGVVTVAWGGFAPINDFNLERSKWNGTSWDSWLVVDGLLTGHGTTDTPTSGGSYRYRLAAHNSSSYSGYSNISGLVKKPAAPTDLSCMLTGSNTITLSWTNSPGNDSDYIVEREEGNTGFIEIGTASKSAITYSDTFSINIGTTYTYRIIAYDSATNTAVSNECSITATIPAAPASLSATVESTPKVTLNWTDNSSSEANFRIERRTNSDDYTEIATVGANISAYVDTSSFQSGSTYTYRVRASNPLGNSTYTNEMTVAVSDIVAPNTLTVTSVSSLQIDLTWSYPGSGSHSTIIERKTGVSGTWAIIYTTASGVLKYSDVGRSPNTQYFYRVRKSFGSGITSIPYPNNNSGTGAYTMLSGLSLTASPGSGNRIYLFWSGNSGNADVVIEKKVASGNFAVLATSTGNTTSWGDSTGLIPGASYTYRIKAKNTSNESVYSNEVTVVNLFLDAPSGLTANANSSGGIDLAWNDTNTDETGFEIWRYMYGSSSYAPYATVDKNIVKFTDTTVQAGIQYNYMVRGYMSGGSMYSSFSYTATAGVGIISPPSNLQFSYVSSTQITLTWTDTSSNESGFKVERKTGEDGSWSVVNWMSANTLSCSITGLSPYTKYYFRVRAYNYTGNFDSLSEELEVSTALPVSPSDINAKAISSTQINITWKDNSDNETGFRILRKSTNGKYFAAVADVGQGVTSYSNRNLASGTLYYYKVVAFNQSGTNESREVSVRTMPSATFTDLSGNASWAKEAIENLAGRGIIEGKTKKLFKPYDSITKAEFTSMMIKAFKLDTTAVGSFADVKVGAWYYNAVMTAENLGIISGDEKNRFFPEKAITKEEMAVIIVKTLEAAGKPLAGFSNSVLEEFWDKNLISPYALSSMASLVGEGIMTVRSGNAIGPKDKATRAEAAVLIYGIIDR